MRRKGMKKLAAALLSGVLLAGGIFGNTALVTQMTQESQNVVAAAKNDKNSVDFSKSYPWVDSNLKEAVSKKTKTDPREDFHLYVNKDWILSNEIPAGMGSWSQYAACEDIVTQKCIGLLEEEDISNRNEELVKTLYRQIKDWDARNKQGVSVLKEDYDRILGIRELKDMTEYMLDEKNTYKGNPFVSIGVSGGLSDAKKNYVYLSSPQFTLGDPAEYQERTELGETYYNCKKEAFVYLAGRLGMDAGEAEKRFDSGIEMEGKLAKDCLTSEDQMASDYMNRINNLMSFEKLGYYDNSFPLRTLIEKKGLKLNQDYIVMEPAYLKSLDEAYTEENVEGLKNLMLINYFSARVNELDKETSDKLDELQKKYFGIEGTMSEEMRAYYKVSNLLNTPMQQVYISRYGKEEDRKKVTKICEDVIATYRKMLKENDWLSKKTKNYAIKKLDNMKIHALYPDEFRDYSQLEIKGLSYSEAVQVIKEFETKYSYSLAGKKVDNTCWSSGMNILSCNAFYSPQENSINLCIGMMGEPFYSEDMSTEDLYASLAAFWVGHEVSHAFDSNGAQIDIQGRLRNWWTKKDLKEFNKRVRKMDKYLDTIIPFGDYHVKGSSVDSEMIADMTGLQCALRMAKDVKGFDYKKFFEKFGTMNVRLNTYINEVSQLTQDTHPLEYLRTNVPVQQFKEFYKAFGVKKGDGMYLAPKDRLIIW